MRPLLVGQAPGPNTLPGYPLFPVPKTSAGGRLQQMMGITRREYLLAFDRVNLLYEFPGRHKRDDKFPIREARLAANAMRPLLADRTVVLVGRNVARAFGRDQEFFEWQEARVRDEAHERHRQARIAVVPHPSGRNHWYNDPLNSERARTFWREFVVSLNLSAESPCLSLQDGV